MKHTHTEKPCLSDRYVFPESDDYVTNATVGSHRSLNLGSGIQRGNPSWSHATVFHPCSPRKRPSQIDRAPDVAIERKSAPIRNLQALMQRKQAIASVDTSPTIMTGRFAGIVTENKKGAHVEGESANDIASNLYKRLAGYVVKSEPSEAELAEVAYLRECKAKETKARLRELDKAIRAKRKAK